MNRRILVSLMVIGVTAATAAGTTFAEFTDTEVSPDNTFAAGELDLQVDWEETYNGEEVETQELTDNPGAIFNINDVKPGDYGEATVSLHVYDNPAYVYMNATQTANLENGCTEPEAEVDDTCGSPGQGEGELGEHLMFTVWNDDGDNVLDQDEEVIFNGTADEFDGTSTPIDADPSTEEIEPFENSTTEYVGIKWNVPFSTGNEIQGDSKKFNFTFHAEQARHNDMDNGTNGEPAEPGGDNLSNAYWQVDLIQGEPSDNLSEESYSEGNRLAYAAHGLFNGSDHVFENPTAALDNSEISCLDDIQQAQINGDDATVQFDVNQACDNITFVSHVKDHSGWDPAQAGEQMVHDSVTEDYDSSEDDAELTVDLPETIPPGYVNITQ